MRTNTVEVMPAVGFAARGISVRSILEGLHGELLPTHVAVDVGLAVARLVRAEHAAGKVVGALDASRVALMENGAISLMAGGEKLAPELKSPGATPTPASDVYAVAHLLYQMFTGHTVGDAVGSHSFSRAREIPAPSQFNPAVSPELNQLVLSSLAFDPRQRPSSAKGIEATLVALTSQEQLDAALDERLALVKRFAPEVPKMAKAPAAPVLEESPSQVMVRPPARRSSMAAVGLLALVLAGWLGHQLFKQHVFAAAPAKVAEAQPAAAAPDPSASHATIAAPIPAEAAPAAPTVAEADAPTAAEPALDASPEQPKLPKMAVAEKNRAKVKKHRGR